MYAVQRKLAVGPIVDLCHEICIEINELNLHWFFCIIFCTLLLVDIAALRRSEVEIAFVAWTCQFYKCDALTDDLECEILSNGKPT